MSASTSSELIGSLNGQGPTALHRAGVAGLYMTREALEHDPNAMALMRSVGGSWERRQDSIRLIWTGEANAFFDQLVKQSFPPPRNGLLALPAFGDPFAHPQHSINLHHAIL